MISLVRPEIFLDPIEVVGCFLEHEGHILLLLRSSGKSEAGTWGNAAGKVESTDSDLVSAVLREVEEETGVRLAPRDLVPKATFYVGYEDKNCIFHTFSASLKERPEISIRPEEHERFIWVTPKDALSLPLMIHEEDTIRHIYEIE